MTRPISYEHTLVWRRTMRLVQALYRLTRRLPEEEKSGLMASVRRTATGVVTSIAAAGARNDPAALAECFNQLQEPLCELDAQVKMIRRLGYASIFHTWPVHRALEDFAELVEREHIRLVQRIRKQRIRERRTARPRTTPSRRAA